MKWLADGTESHWICVQDLSPIVSKRSDLTEDYSHARELGVAIRKASLTSVDLSKCWFDAGSATALSEGLRWDDGTMIQNLVLLSNPIPSDVLNMITTAAGDAVNVQCEGAGILPSDGTVSVEDTQHEQQLPVTDRYNNLDPRFYNTFGMESRREAYVTPLRCSELVVVLSMKTHQLSISARYISNRQHFHQDGWMSLS